MNKHLDLACIFDVFKVDKKFNVSEDPSNDKIEKMGSRVGGFFSLVLYITILLRFIIAINRMQGGLDDNQFKNSRSNHLIDGENIIKVGQTDFLPSLELLW